MECVPLHHDTVDGIFCRRCDPGATLTVFALLFPRDVFVAQTRGLVPATCEGSLLPTLLAKGFADFLVIHGIARAAGLARFSRVFRTMSSGSSSSGRMSKIPLSWSAATLWCFSSSQTCLAAFFAFSDIVAHDSSHMDYGIVGCWALANLPFIRMWLLARRSVRFWNHVNSDVPKVVNGALLQVVQNCICLPIHVDVFQRDRE